MTAAGLRRWWRDGVLYQVYPRSFADGDGDGVGDLRGLTQRLDHLAWLGVDGVWLSPIMPSPDADWGYDVADYRDVHPAFGTLADLDELVAAAGARGIRILLDLVPNHTSDRHPWFREALAGRDSTRRDWYVWADPKPDGAPPTNWLSAFGGPAWTLDEASGQHYLHHFLPEQPDLNWWNEDVRGAFDEILRFWFARGIAGFRIDVPHFLGHDPELRDNPPAEEGDPAYVHRYGQRPVWNFMRPELHEVAARWRELADAQEPPRLLVGEGVIGGPEVAAFYPADDDGLHMTFHLGLANAPFEAAALREVVEEAELLLPPGAQPLWTLGNHDIPRYGSRWAGADPAKARAALVLLFGLRGTPTLYYGDELGLGDVPVPDHLRRDPVGRDPERTPMPWSPEPGLGFTTPAADPWLPYGDRAGLTVAEQRDDPGSALTLTRDLVALRRRSPDLRAGGYRRVEAPEGAWAWRRGEGTLVAVNLGGEERAVEGVEGAIAVASTRGRDGERVSGRLVLRPWQAAIVTR
ncbi:MAG TPA: alpha-amylase family glycosyl hydrolase [Gaiellaceae bacterium]|nr:alpha-amylase family glycosyl hydrolase [Gaiellaceae bacterium]